MTPFSSRGRWALRGETFFETNFSEYSVGENPYDWGVTPTPGDVLVQNVPGSISGKALTRPDASNGQSFNLLFRILRAPPGYNFEVLASLRTNTVYSGINRRVAILALRRSPETTGINPSAGGSLYLTSSTVGLNHQLLQAKPSGSGWEGLSFNQTQIGSPYANEWVWWRVRLEGFTLRSRVWKRGQAEPATWLEDTIDGSIDNEGELGISNGSANASDLEMDYLAADVRPEGSSPATIPLPI